MSAVVLLSFARDYQRLSEIAGDYWRFSEIAGDCQRFVRDCQRFSEIAGDCCRLPEIVRDCRRMSEIAGDCRRLSEIVRDCRRFVGDCLRLPEIVRDCRRLPEIAGDFGCLLDLLTLNDQYGNFAVWGHRILISRIRDLFSLSSFHQPSFFSFWIMSSIQKCAQKIDSSFLINVQ